MEVSPGGTKPHDGSAGRGRDLRRLAMGRPAAAFPSPAEHIHCGCEDVRGSGNSADPLPRTLPVPSPAGCPCQLCHMPTQKDPSHPKERRGGHELAPAGLLLSRDAAQHRTAAGISTTTSPCSSYTPAPGVSTDCRPPTGQNPAPARCWGHRPPQRSIIPSCHHPQPPPHTTNGTVPPALCSSRHLLYSPPATSLTLPCPQELPHGPLQTPMSPWLSAQCTMAGPQLSSLWTRVWHKPLVTSVPAPGRSRQPHATTPGAHPHQGDGFASPLAWHPSAHSAWPWHYSTVRNGSSSSVQPRVHPHHLQGSQTSL